jgi:predicted nucleotidyltransferase
MGESEFTRRSSTLTTSLDEVLKRLRRQDEVDGLMVIGSTARNETHGASDYDLVILMSELPVPVDLGHTIIEGRHTDLRFMTFKELDEQLGSDEPINPYTSIGTTFLRMGDGRIEKDRSGRLERASSKVAAGVALRLLDD